MAEFSPLERVSGLREIPSAFVDLAPYQTAAWPGCGGRLKATPEDFEVDELPLYLPSGNGEHLYLRLWKRNLSTSAAVQRLSDATGIPVSRIGWAGRKDAQAVTTQWVSLHSPAGAGNPPLQFAEGQDLRILEVTRHGNKLRRGHLRGNRFAVRIRDARCPARWEQLLLEIRGHGFPNRFGAQRFGPDGRNPGTGRRILARSGAARHLQDRERFLIHAYQAALFNGLLSRRLAVLGSLSELVPGDLALLHQNGATFTVAAEALADLKIRIDSNEISPSAPLFGYRVPLATEEPGSWEREALVSEHLSLADFRLGSKDASITGERRAVRAFAPDLTWSEIGDEATPVLRLQFTLASGVYATALLRELMKVVEADPAGPTLPHMDEA